MVSGPASVQSQANGTWDGVIVHHHDKVAIGGMGFKAPPDETGRIELGYGLIPEYWNRGYATEMAKALVEWALAQAGVKIIVAECSADNFPSFRVLEKVGFQTTETTTG